MKRLLLILITFLFLFSTVTIADAVSSNKTLKFAWEQIIPSDMGGWTMHYGLNQGGPYVMTVDIPYDTCNMTTSPPECAAPVPIIMIVGGGEATYYFVLDAYDLSGNYSDLSNEVSQALDFLPPGVPTEFTVVIPLGQ